MSLIHRLNQMVKLSPDEITARLKCKGWVQGKDFTPEQYADWENQQVRVWRTSDLGNYRCDWGCGYVKRNLPTHWFKLTSEYGGEDDQPDLEA